MEKREKLRFRNKKSTTTHPCLVEVSISLLDERGAGVGVVVRQAESEHCESRRCGGDVEIVRGIDE